MRIHILGLFAALFLSGLSAPASVRETDCTGTGAIWGPPPTLVLTCSGSCGTGQSCETHTGSDGGGDFTYCGCYEGDTDSCCTVVVRNNQARKYGSCPPCGTTGKCKLIGDGYPGGQGGFEPICTNEL